MLDLWKKSYDQLRQHIKKQRYYFANKGPSSQTMVFPVVMYGCENWTIKSWVLKNWWFWTVVLEKTLESPLGSKEIKPVHPKGNQSWIFIGRTDAEVPILWPSDEKNWLIGKDPDVGNDWRQEGKGMTREWDGCMASPRWWTSVWASSQSWKPSMLQSMGSQRVRQDWVTELTDF